MRRGPLQTTGYALLLRQNGEGCDYTIGCGLRVHPLHATTVEAARAEAIALFKDDEYRLDQRDVPTDVGAYSITEATIIRIEGSVVEEVRTWMAEQKAAEERKRAAKAEAEERSLLARLQAKWGAK